MAIFKALILSILLSAFCGAATIHVPGDYSTIQKAIDAAVNSDTVVVAPGTYPENIDFKGKALLVTSSAGPASTVIDGRKLDSVVKFINSEGLDSIIEGFTITNGRSFSGCGIHCYHSSPTIRYNIITANVTDQAFIDSYGGGIYVAKGSPEIHDNVVSKNSIFTVFGVAYGGGIFCSVGSPVVKGNRIVENIGGTYGGGIFCNDTARVEGNTIAGNNAHYGSGIYAAGDVEIVGNIIEHNEEHSSTPFGYGGGILAVGFSPVIEGNLIRGNNALNYAGGVMCTGTVDARVTNNTIHGNTTDPEESIGGGGLYVGSGGTVTAANNIIRDNWAADGKQIFIQGNYGPDTLTIHHSNVEGGVSEVYVAPGSTLNWQAGMIDVDPLFADQEDLHLQYGSPCRDAGDNDAVSFSTDFEGDPRMAQGTVDMGADEFYTHLYVTGDQTPGGGIEGKLVGTPGTSPVGLFIGAGVLGSPVNTAWGLFYLEAPWLLLPLIPIPGNGILTLPATIPVSPPAPYDLPMQGLVGLNPDSLTNVSVLEVR